MDSKVVTAWFKEFISSILEYIIKELHINPVIIIIIVLLLIIFRKK